MIQRQFLGCFQGCHSSLKMWPRTGRPPTGSHSGWWGSWLGSGDRARDGRWRSHEGHHLL